MPGGSELRGQRFLVADDDEAFLGYVSSLLSLHGAQSVVGVRCGVEALDVIAGSPLDAVVSDHRMPPPTGVQLLAMTRTAGYTRPFVIVTAFPGDELVKQVSLMDSAIVLAKPFTPSALIAGLSAALPSATD